MAEESQHLVGEQSSINTESLMPRTITCSKRSLISALSVFVGLLFVGQAVTVYFLVQHQSNINDLHTTTVDLKLQNLIKKLPGSPSHSVPKQKMRMATIDIPLMVMDGNQPPRKSTNELKGIAESSNKVEDAVHYILRKGGPTRFFPSFNGTVLENLRELKKTLTDVEWMIFDQWMQQWFLFYLVQNKKTPDANLPTNRAFSTEAPVMSRCQLQARSHHMPGGFKPECDENGDFMPVQCWRSTGYCWCVYKNGTEIPETKTRGKLDCSSILDLYDSATGSADTDYSFSPFD
ncbi:HLA class II histocompatibility antigen gamma chain [Spea bombifrons]|uniref:HLA class II histocompatibility antigen gamma chain n=1 Tax=Spea bombifrons TaxID=233779 RepID=UPI0023496975|nr:HLA class II histocompatibility antigen gamma chain [Spea bombifrons]